MASAPGAGLGDSLRQRGGVMRPGRAAGRKPRNNTAQRGPPSNAEAAGASFWAGLNWLANKADEALVNVLWQDQPAAGPPKQRDGARHREGPRIPRTKQPQFERAGVSKPDANSQAHTSQGLSPTEMSEQPVMVEPPEKVLQEKPAKNPPRAPSQTPLTLEAAPRSVSLEAAPRGISFENAKESLRQAFRPTLQVMRMNSRDVPGTNPNPFPVDRQFSSGSAAGSRPPSLKPAPTPGRDVRSESQARRPNSQSAGDSTVPDEPLADFEFDDAPAADRSQVEPLADAENELEAAPDSKSGDEQRHSSPTREVSPPEALKCDEVGVSLIQEAEQPVAPEDPQVVAEKGPETGVELEASPTLEPNESIVAESSMIAGTTEEGEPAPAEKETEEETPLATLPEQNVVLESPSASPENPSEAAASVEIVQAEEADSSERHQSEASPTLEGDQASAEASSVLTSDAAQVDTAVPEQDQESASPSASTAESLAAAAA